VEGRLGIRVVMTRDDDRNVLVTDRAAIANNNKADVFISLHANASLRPELSGTAIYIAAFDDSEEARQALVPERLPAFGGGFRDIELVPWYLAQIRYKDKSATMAAILAQQLQDRLPASPHPVEHAPLRILESANMPAVLIEMGYLSNVAQEKQLAGNDFQGGAVQAIVDAIIRFRDLLTAQQGVVP
jgi:N-acetylmuramoyl-L-alanine amidase